MGEFFLPPPVRLCSNLTRKGQAQRHRRPVRTLVANTGKPFGLLGISP